MKEIKLGIIGLGNCASSLIQGIHFYKGEKDDDLIGLMHPSIGGYKPEHIKVVSAFDIDVRKVGKDVSEAIYAKPNCTKTFNPNVPYQDVKVSMGRVLDSYSNHMSDRGLYSEDEVFLPASEEELSKSELVNILQESGTEVLLNYLPVGSEKAGKFYAEAALEAGVGLVNCMPVFIASNPEWSKKFEERNIPIIGDDVKSQIGATITHRVLTELFDKRGVELKRTYQLNTGGNTDFLNMKNNNRLKSKKTSKTNAVQSTLRKPLDDKNIHIGPSDYVPWQEDNKIAFIRMEGEIFGHVPIDLELRLSVEDSPNSGGVVIDAIRCMKLALDRRIGGVLYSPSAYFMKSPPKQLSDAEAYNRVNEFIKNERER